MPRAPRPIPASETTLVRFEGNVLRLANGDCWLWLGHTMKNGYGQIGIGDDVFLTHRVAYELFKGPIPTGMTLDHLCRNRRCVNPEHLEPVTNRTNILRGTAPSALAARATHCPKGHPYDEQNTYRYAVTGQRMCRACGLARNTERHYAKKFIAWWSDTATEAAIGHRVKKSRPTGGRRIPWRM